MKISEIANEAEAEVLFKAPGFDSEDIVCAVAADMMSEVMVDTADGSLMITGLMNPQVIRTAEMMNVSAILFVRGKEVQESLLTLAEDRGVSVLRTKLTTFEVCGRLYKAGLVSGQ